MEQFLIILTFLIIGKGLRHVPDFPDETGTVLNMFVIYVSMPALVLQNVPQMVFSKDLLVLMIMPWAVLLLSCALILLFSRIFKWSRSVTGCLMLLIPLGNTSFFGFPMVKAFFGEGAIPYALVYDQVGSFLGLAVYGSFILAVYGSAGSRPTVKSVTKKIITFPPFIALIIAVLLKPVEYPPAFMNLLAMLSSTLVPLVMTAVGFQLTLRLNREDTFQLGFGLLVKLVAVPAAALIFCKAAGLEGEAVRISIFETGMPPMISAGALAIMANLSPALTSALVGVGIIISFATLPALYHLLSFI